MTMRAMIATMASLFATGDDHVAKFEGVRVDGREGEHCGNSAVPGIRDIGQVLSKELFKQKESRGVYASFHPARESLASTAAKRSG